MNDLYKYQGQLFNFEILEKFNLKKMILENLNCDENYLTYIESREQAQCFSFKEITLLALKISQYIRSLNLPSHARIGVIYSNSYEIIPVVLGCILTDISFQLINPKDQPDKIIFDFKFDRPLSFYLDSQVVDLDISFWENKTFDPEKEFCLFSSSGTTGSSKTVVHSSKSIISNLAATIEAHQLNQRKIIFNCLPLYHVNGFNFAFLASYFSRSKLIHTPSFIQSIFFRIIETYRPEIINLVPTLIRLLNDDPRKKDLAPYTHYAVSAASFLNLKDARSFYEYYKIPIIQSYGLSESVNFSTISPTNYNKFTFQEYLNLDENRISIGSAVIGNDLFILKNSPKDIEGEICIRGWNIFLEYLDNEDETKKAFTDQYFHTGDIGYSKRFNNQDFFFISGRLKEIIKYNGVLFHLADIDQYFLNYESVKNCVSCTYLSDGEEKLGLLISTDLTENEIKKYFNVKYNKLLKIDQILITSELPIGSTGKKNRNEASKRLLNQRKI